MTDLFQVMAKSFIADLRAKADECNFLANDNVDRAANMDMRDYLRLVAHEAERVLASGLTNRHPEKWRMGQHYNIHVYQGETPVCTALTPEFARRIVQDHNTLLERTDG